MNHFELSERLELAYPNVWFCENGRTVHFGPKVVKVTLENGEPKYEGPGFLVMDVEEVLS